MKVKLFVILGCLAGLGASCAPPNPELRTRSTATVPDGLTCNPSPDELKNIQTEVSGPYVYLRGTFTNLCPTANSQELTVTMADANGVVLRTISFWPNGRHDIAHGQTVRIMEYLGLSAEIAHVGVARGDRRSWNR